MYVLPFVMVCLSVCFCLLWHVLVWVFLFVMVRLSVYSIVCYGVS